MFEWELWAKFAVLEIIALLKWMELGSSLLDLRQNTVLCTAAGADPVSFAQPLLMSLLKEGKNQFIFNIQWDLRYSPKPG